MKNFLIPTDFSENARHALKYGYSLAKKVKANMIICNAVTEPAEIPQTGMVSWPIEENDFLSQDSRYELNKLKKQLEDKEETIGFNPAISCLTETGIVTDIVNDMSNHYNAGLVIIGTHSGSGLSTLLLGNHSRKMIDEIGKPLLLVPPSAVIKPIKKIAFATDFENTAQDLNAIYLLITLAKPLNAEILITNIFNKDQHAADQFLVELSDKADYPHIYYRAVKSHNPVSGLNWLCEHGDIDMLTMVHRDHSFIDSLFKGSQTQKMAGHISIPLLVFPAL